MNKTILTPDAPLPIGPYSQAILSNGTLYCSGQIPLDAGTGAMTGDNITEQTEKVCQNISEILKAAGMDFNNVIKTTCFIADMKDFAEFNKVYETYFISKPARSCVAVKELPRSVLVEIEVIGIV